MIISSICWFVPALSILAVPCGEFSGQPHTEHTFGSSETLDPSMKLDERLTLLKGPLEQGPTIIYVPTRKETLNIAKYLCRCGVKAAAYNAKVYILL